MRPVLLVVFVVLCVPLAWGIDTGQAFDDPVLQARYEKIISEVRCVQCQNQNIKDSNVQLAADLRREIRRMIGEGMSDAEIYAFLVDRYGQFVLYRPKAGGKTLLLWIAPALFLLGGALMLVRVVRRRMALPIDVDADTDNESDDDSAVRS